MREIISFAEYHIKNTDINFLEKYWDYEKNTVNPYKIGKCSHTKVWIKCQNKSYHYSYEMTCANFTNGQRCPYCNSFASHKVHYFGSLGFLYHNIAKMIVEDERNNLTYEDTYKIAPKCSRKFYMKCPNCGCGSKNKKIISNIHYQGFSCEYCSDGISYPNKLMCNLLKELNIDFITEYSPEWANNKKYDFYIPSLKLIIEMDGGIGHGHEHVYKDRIESIFDDWRKEWKANENDIMVIRIDCDYPKRGDRLEFIKKNILEKLTMFDYSKINWILIDEISNNSRCRYIWELWNKGMKSTKELKNYTGFDRSTITEYLKRGNKLGIIDYNPKKEYENRKYPQGKNHSGAKSIICLTTKRIFYTIKEGAEYYKCNRISISNCCKGDYKSAGKLPDGTPLVWRYLVWNHDKRYRIKK